MSDLFYTGRSRHTNGAFSVTMKDGAKLAKKLEKLKDGGEVAIKRTVSDFATRGPGWVSKGIREHYGVDTAAIKEAAERPSRGRTSIRVAGISVDGATLEYKGRTLTPIHFKMSPKSRPSGQQKYTVKATILKGSRVSMKQGTFITAVNGGSPLPFQRTGKGRTPIEAVRTLSVPQMIDGKAKETIEEIIGTKLEKRFERHIQQAMK